MGSTLRRKEKVETQYDLRLYFILAWNTRPPCGREIIQIILKF